MKRILCLIFAFITVLSCMWLPTFAAQNTLDTTSVEEDLESINLDTDLYIQNLLGKETELVITRESGYSNGTSDLYLYVYIADSLYSRVSVYGKQLVYDELVVKLASNFDENGNPITFYNEYASYVSRSEDCLFYKFRLNSLSGIDYENGRLYYIDSYTIQPRDIPGYGYVDSSGQYQKELEVLQFETRQTNKCNKAFLYTGNEKKNTLSCNVFEDSVIDLDTHSTVYRTVSSDKGPTFRYDVFSVYFRVPNEYFEKYDYLKTISYNAREQMWNGVVCSDYDLLDRLNKMRLKDFSKVTNGDHPAVFVEPGVGGVGVPGVFQVSSGIASYAINPWQNLSNLCYQKRESHLLNAFYVEDFWNKKLSIEPELIENFYDYNQKGEPSTLKNYTVSVDDNYTLGSLESKIPSPFYDFCDFYFGFHEDISIDRSDIESIVMFEDMSALNGYIEGSNDTEYAAELLVNKRDLPDFKTELETAIANNETLVLFRFAMRDYYTNYCVIIDNPIFEIPDINGYFGKGTAFNDFNIISLTFRKGKLDFIVLVNNESQDINGGLTAPGDSPFGGGDDTENEEDMFDKILAFISIALVAVVVILIISLFYKPKIRLELSDNSKNKRKDNNNES